MNDQTEASSRKWWASALMIGGVIALVCLPIGALGTKLGLWQFTGGFLLLGVGAVLAAAVFFLGVIAVVFTSVRKMSAERSAAAIGLILSVVVIGVLGGQYMSVSAVPAIHNITTDTDDPPQFATLVAVREAEQANPLELSAEVIEQHRKAYAHLKPMISDLSSTEMFSRAVATLEAMGMEVADANPGAGRIEATDETFWFGFKDDVVVRIRAQGGGSVVDVRSVSRVGQSDLGKNAQRIGEILAALAAN